MAFATPAIGSAVSIVPGELESVGRIAPEKGQMEFVKARPLLNDEFPQARFVICGAPLFGARSDYFDAVRLRARGLPVEFVGWQRMSDTY